MKTLKSICKALLFGSIFICMFPIKVFADQTYTVVPKECFTFINSRNASGSINTDFKREPLNNEEYRSIAYTFSDGKIAYFIVHDKTHQTEAASISTESSGSCSTQRATWVTKTVDGVVYDTINDYKSTTNRTYTTYVVTYSYNGNMPSTTADKESFWLNYVYPYTFGGASIEPTPEPINWGSVRDPEYSTRIAGSGSAAKQNVDVLRWNKEIDTNGNDISECEVEIQAVPGSWSDSTLQGLLNQAVNAFNSTGVQPVTLDTVPAVDGLYNCSWQRIINTLNWNFDYLLARETQADLWEKYGWYYRVRLLSPDGYEGQWQTLYTPLSSSAQDSETVINHNSFDMSVNQVYQNITQLNNNTSVTIVYNDTDYTVQNPDNGTEPTGGTTLWDILKELLNGIFQILAKLGDLIVGLVDGLFDLFRSLFTPPEVDQTVNNDINLNINNYITESQPGLQDQQLHLHQIFSDLDSISSAYSSGGDCVLEWDDVAMDLSVFNAGNVTFIPGGTYDFKAAFMQLLAGFGMTYATYQMLVSGVIYILLFVLISHKVKGFLKKT